MKFINAEIQAITQTNVTRNRQSKQQTRRLHDSSSKEDYDMHTSTGYT